MSELKIQIDDNIIKSFGKDMVENYIQDFITKALLKLAAKEILEDLPNVDIDQQKWQQARKRAWNRSGQYFINVIANV
jgi:hypothetical protein